MNLNVSKEILQLCPTFLLASYNIQNNLLRPFWIPDKDVGYQKCQAGSPDGDIDFGVISKKCCLMVVCVC